jgi:hypothetical protein
VATALFGIAALAVTFAFQLLPPVRRAYPNGDFAAAMGRFQLASTPEALQDVFGDPPDPAIVDAMEAANLLDLFLYIPVYGGFLLAGALMLADGLRRSAWLIIVPTLVGIAGDAVETSTQLRITANPSNGAASLTSLIVGTWAKAFGLAAGALACATVCLLGPRKRWPLGLLSLAPMVGAMAARSDPTGRGPATIVGTGLFWLALLATAAYEAVRPGTREGRGAQTPQGAHS